MSEINTDINYETNIKKVPIVEIPKQELDRENYIVNVKSVLDAHDGGRLNTHLLLIDAFFLGSWLVAIICVSISILVNRRLYARILALNFASSKAEKIELSKVYDKYM